jgi:hypothetical protein
MLAPTRHVDRDAPDLRPVDTGDLHAAKSKVGGDPVIVALQRPQDAFAKYRLQVRGLFVPVLWVACGWLWVAVAASTSSCV